MNERLYNSHLLILGLLVIAALSSFLNGKEKLKYTQKPTLSIEYKKKETQTVSYGDSLFLVKTKQDIPLYYFKNVISEVCFDQECRLLEIVVYWNITGRYLGFELPEGEFLSKHDHEPFVESEYEKLNDLLADANLPLANISFEKLIEIPDQEENQVDGVSGATTPEVSKMVVKGAAYTTYTLWNIVNGSTKSLIERVTAKQLSSNLIHMILNSEDINDRIWVLDKINEETVITPSLSSSLLDLITGEDYFLAYSAINSIKTAHINSRTLQIALFSIYGQVDHSIQSMIIEKLGYAHNLCSDLVVSSRNMLSQLNGKQLGDLLKLYSRHSIADLETCQVVAKILKNENTFISQQAYKFLKKSNPPDEKVAELIELYEKRK